MSEPNVNDGGPVFPVGMVAVPCKPPGILEKLSPEEREALREVCQAAMQYAMEWGSTEEECVKMKIRQLLGDVEWVQLD